MLTGEQRSCRLSQASIQHRDVLRRSPGEVVDVRQDTFWRDLKYISNTMRPRAVRGAVEITIGTLNEASSRLFATPERRKQRKAAARCQLEHCPVVDVHAVLCRPVEATVSALHQRPDGAGAIGATIELHARGLKLPCSRQFVDGPVPTDTARIGIAPKGPVSSLNRRSVRILAVVPACEAVENRHGSGRRHLENRAAAARTAFRRSRRRSPT
jgi:hypothetical protein